MSRNTRTALLLFAWLSCSQLSHAQYYNLTFRNYASPEGLTLSEVIRVFQDSAGFLWVCTSYGLSRFDGRQIKNFYHVLNDPHSLGEDYVQDITQGRRNRLWIAFQNEFGEMDPFTSRVHNHPIESLRTRGQPLRLFGIVVDSDERVWLGTSEGLAAYDPSTGRLEKLKGQDWGAPESAVLSLARDPDGRIWAGTQGNGLWSVHGKSDSMVRMTDAKTGGMINGICFTGSDSAWLACGNGLFSLLPDPHASNGISLRRAEFMPAHEELRSVLVDRKRNIWIATPANGLYIYFPKTGFLDVLKENFSSTRGLLSNRIWSLAGDSWGGVWIASESGLQSFHEQAQRFNIYPGISKKTNELRGSFIYGIYEKDNDLLIATSGSVLAYNRLTNRFIPIQINHELGNMAIRFRTIQRESENHWWISSDHGFFELERKGQEYELHRLAMQKTFPQLGKWSFRNFLKGKQGDFWFSTEDSGLVYCHPSRRKWERYLHDVSRPTSLSNNAIMVIAYDKQGKILVGNESGLSIFDPATQAFFNIKERSDSIPNGLSDKSVFDIVDDGAHYWVGTYGGGLNMVDKQSKKVTTYPNPGGKGSDAINMMVSEGDSVLWMGTNNGLAQFRIRTRQFQNFGIEDGMPANEFNMYSRYRNEEGEIYMGTIEGMFSFHPDSVTQSKLSPLILLSRMRLNGRQLEDSIVSQVNRDLRYSIKWGQDLYLEFSPMTFFGNNNYHLKYQVVTERPDTTWRDGEAGYLLPLARYDQGEYTIAVKFDDIDSRDSKEWKMRLTVVPPFWMTWPFRIVLISLGLFLLYLAIRRYISRRLEGQRQEFERQQLIEKERSRISAELHDDIGGGLTAIRLMSEMVKEQDVQAGLKTIHGKISDAANDIVQKMNEIVWALNINHDDLPSLVAYTRHFAVAYLDDMGLHSSFNVPDRIPEMRVSGVNRRNIFLLVKESLNNIVKHAGATEVEVSIRLDRNLNILVRDNGKGISVAPSQGNGLVNMRKRVANMGGQMDIANDQGAVLKFTIPLDRLGA